MTPQSISIRMYDVGRGDCFLLSIAYRRGESRHVLIDFGTTANNASEERTRLAPIAEDIAARCGGKLHAVVATHRHHDHIGGFARLKQKSSPGATIAKLNPEVVIQPWTENPALPGDFGLALHRIAIHNSADIDPGRRDLLLQIARQNYSNRKAVESLHQLGRKRLYVRAGSRLEIGRLLPGLSVRVLGPPRSAISRYPFDASLMPFRCPPPSPGASPRPLFPNTPQWHPALAPPRMRWFVDRINRLRSEQILRLATTLNTEINNSSVVLLIEGCGQRLLFPGDLEQSGWAKMLAQPEARSLLRDVTVYKASHHGLESGTPKSLWELFRQQPATLVSASHVVSGGVLAGVSRIVQTPTLRPKGEFYADIELKPGAPSLGKIAA